jgi:hypothetical protein
LLSAERKLELAEQLEFTQQAVNKAKKYLNSYSSSDSSSSDDLTIDNPLCDTCKSVVGTLDSILMNNKVEFAAEAALATVCSSYLTMDICWGFTRQLGHVVISNFVDFILSQNYFCEDVIPVCRKGDYEL